VVAGVLVILALPASGWAQEPGSLEVAGGYSFLGHSELFDGFGLGWLAEGGWRATRRLSLTAEVSRHRRTQDVGFIDVDVTFQSILAGPRIWLSTTRFALFVHTLAGVTSLDVVARSTFPIDSNANDSASYGTLQIGGGVEVPLNDRLALRVGADYRRVFTADGLHDPRFSTGAAYRFGGR
jgi:opacity protein-like surface antigen